MNQKTLTNNLQQEIGDIGHNITDAIGRAIAASIMADGNTSERTQPATTPTVATPTVATMPKAKARTQNDKAKANENAIAKAKAKLAALETEIAEQVQKRTDTMATETKAIEQARERERIRKAQDDGVVDVSLGLVDGVHVAPGIVLTAIDNETQTITLRASFAVGAKIATKQGSYQLYAHTVSQGLQARRGGYCPLGNSGLSLSLKLAKFSN